MTLTDSPTPDVDGPDPSGDQRRRRAIIGIIGAFLVALVVIVVVQWNTDTSSGGRAATLPDVTLTTLDGSDVRLVAITGQPTVVNFFASWCAPCRAELPELQAVSREVADTVDFIGINTRETDVDAARELLDLTGVTYPVLLGDDGTVYQEVGGLAMPTTAFVDASGTIVEVHSGVLDADSLRDKLAEHFG